MKRSICVVSLLIATLFCVSVCMADSDIPNLTGTWVVKTEGGLLLKGKEPGPKTHHTQPFSSLNAEAVITKQQGRIMHGTFKSQRATENFVGAIGLDNKTLYGSYEQGFWEGKIIDKDTIQIAYRHVTPTDSVVAVGVWTRKK
ncbi:MAG: hypothetical protein NTU97_02180 [Candidatus Magasanikbacteria bacterium]|nr:hypothetical protein [Candidatus Magasanikbacteria bacterium]